MRLIGFEKKKRERRYGGYWDFFIIKRRGRERMRMQKRERKREVGELGNQVKTNGAAGLEVK